jgi:phosphate transport system permease protein
MSAPTVSPDSTFKERPESEKILDKGFVGLTTAFAIAIGVILLLIALVIFIRALPAIQTFGLGFLTSSAWNPVRGREEFGVLPVIYGTLVSSLIALLIAVPLGIGSAIFLSEDFIPLNARTILVFLVQLFAAIPSVVYGLWGIFVLIPILRPLGNWLNANFSWIPLFSTPLRSGMLPAGVILAIMILPIIIAISRDSLAALPPDLRQASLGLGQPLGNDFSSLNSCRFFWDCRGDYVSFRAALWGNHGSNDDYRQF